MLICSLEGECSYFNACTLLFHSIWKKHPYALDKTVIGLDLPFITSEQLPKRTNKEANKQTENNPHQNLSNI